MISITNYIVFMITTIFFDSLVLLSYYWCSLTHLTLDKMAAISQTTFSNVFSWMKRFVFQSEFHCFSLKVQLTKNRIGSGNGLALNNREAIIWINADPVHRRIYAALGGDVLSDKRHSMATDKFFRIVCLKRHHCVTGPVWLIWSEN